MVLIIILIILFLFLALKTGGKEGFYAGKVWFDAIKDGTKTVDVRRGTMEKYIELLGDPTDKKKKVSLTYRHKKDTITVQVKEMQEFKSWADLLKAIPVEKIAPHLKTNEEFIVEMSKYIDLGGKDECITALTLKK